MTLYLDTSSLVKLYIEEPDSAAVADAVSRATIVATSSVAYAEARAAFARRRRERLITADACAKAIRQLNRDWEAFLTVEVTDDVARSAGMLTDRLNLRGFDAIHLASFGDIVGRAGDDEVEFSAADARLVKAARHLG